MDLVLEGGTIVTMDPERRVLREPLLVSNGTITSVGQEVLEPRVSGNGAGARIVRHLDCEGKVIIPGLVQSHVHLCQTLLRGYADGLELMDWLRDRVWPFEGRHTFETMRSSVLLGIAELIRGGTTACLDMGSVRHTDAVFEAAAEAGYRLTCGKSMMDEQDVVPVPLRESTEDSLAESDALAGRWHGACGGRLRYAYAPRFVLSCTERLLREVADRASGGSLVHTHASENRNELAAVRRTLGKDNVAYLHELGISGSNVALAHCIWLGEDEKRLLAETGTHVLHCPSSNLKLGSGIAEIPELMKEGARVSLGADGAPCNNNLDMWTEMRLAALVHLPRVGAGGLTAEQVFEMATLGGARALGIEDEIGSIEVGKRADLAILNLESPHSIPPGEDVYSRLVYSGRSADVESVLIDGELVLEQGVLKTLDENSVLSGGKKNAAGGPSTR